MERTDEGTNARKKERQREIETSLWIKTRLTLEATFGGAPLVVGEIDEGAECNVDESVNDGAHRLFALGGVGERMTPEEFVTELQSRHQSGQQRRIPEGNEIFDVVLILVGDAV